MVANGGYGMDEGAAREARRKITELALRGARDPSFGNARAIRSLYEKIVTTQSERLAVSNEDPSILTDDDLTTITRLDVESGSC